MWKSNNVDHTMTCKKGGFVCIRHDEVRDLTASMFREVCRDVSTEPTLLPLNGEHMQYMTANTANEARCGRKCSCFWSRGQRAFMDIRIFDPMAACYQRISLEAAHQKNERDKSGVMEIGFEMSTTAASHPLVFTTSGWMGPKAKCFY
ncbi:hypothetical protein GWK47_046071 [Chionoecetes opilio]|uniref:Uncharacterized protein n=1 Tax=Chionoecetes opilio TaxID=41210 RepID=A0A8J5CH82_CHIOP|nr:hypothetical protein GWK47_046071 [Chionoecetes opilio]